ncbi:hypothetical protein [Haloparvum sedimenti]|uniref:hypothetical protein n=1 Tax=Haloparvum sedimenti TaxID=1678448 RepID=UPI00071E9D43|nr:hypothetical protein [Haloparvum sedimenti]
MTGVYPEPAADDIPVNTAAEASIGAGQRAIFTFTATQRVHEGFRLPILAASKRSQSSYEILLDGDRVYGPSPIPPTDIDDLAVCWVPAHEFQQEIVVKISNLSDTERRYTVQPVGFERVGGDEDGT